MFNSKTIAKTTAQILSPNQRRWKITSMVAIGAMVGIYGLSAFNPFQLTAKQSDLQSINQPKEENLSLGIPITQSLLVKFKSDTSQSEQLQILSQIDGQIKKSFKRLQLHIVAIPETINQAEAQKTLQSSPQVEYAEIDREVEVTGAVDDTHFASQYALTNMQVPDAWDTTMGSAEVSVAVLDSGVQADHEDLTGQITHTANFSNSASAADENGHGTGVAGVIAAKANNSLGIAGIAPNSKLMSAKVVNENGNGNYSWYVYGVMWAVDNGADIINMSLGRYDSTPGTNALNDAVNYAWENDVVVVGAAGNSGVSTKFYPAALENVIAVGGVEQDDTILDYTSGSGGSIKSNYGNWVEVAAPGLSIATTCYATDRTNRYCNMVGTSFAAPQVSGVAALIKAAHPDWTNAMIRKQLELTADPIAGTGTYWTYGRVNALAAVTEPSPISDLTATDFILMDASGQPRTIFYPGESVYAQVTITNQGGFKSGSSTGQLIAQFYSDQDSPASQGAQSDVSMSVTIPDLAGGISQTYNSIDSHRFTQQKSWSKTTPGDYTARIFINYDHDGQELTYDNNQATLEYSIISPQTGTVQSYLSATGLTPVRFKGEKRTLIQPKTAMSLTQVSCYLCGDASIVKVYNSDVNSAVGAVLSTSSTNTTEGDWSHAPIDAPLQADQYYLISFSPATTPSYYGTTPNTSHPDIHFLSRSGSGTPIPKDGAYYIKIDYNK